MLPSGLKLSFKYFDFNPEISSAGVECYTHTRAVAGLRFLIIYIQKKTHLANILIPAQ